MEKDRKNTCAGYSSEQAEIVDKEKLVYNGYARHLLCANLADHDIVQKTYKVADAVLNHDRNGDGEHHFVKAFVPDKFVS